jgi:hypothetical protein
MWRYKDGFVVNEKGKVLDVDGKLDRENRNVGVYPKHGDTNQQWEIVYVDEMPAEPQAGELNREFGILVDKPFHVQSMLPDGRYLDSLSGQMVIKVPNGQGSQLWEFRNADKTIFNHQHKSQAWSVQSNGRSNRMLLQRSNRNWWQLFRYDATS